MNTAAVPVHQPWPLRRRCRAWCCRVGRAAILVSLVTAISCAPPPRRRDWSPGDGYQALLAVPLERFNRLQDLTAEAELTIRVGRERQRALAVLQVKNPDLMKLEVRGPLFSHVLTAVMVGDSLYVHGPATGGIWQGATDGFLLEFLTGVDLGGYDLRYALLGLVEKGDVDPLQPTVYPRGDRAIVPLVSVMGEQRRIWVDLHRGLVVREEIRVPGAYEELVRHLSEYQRVSTLLLPAVVELEQGDNMIRLDYRRYRIDTGLERVAFEAAVPRGSIRRLD